MIRSGRIALPHFRGLLCLPVRRFIWMLGVGPYCRETDSCKYQPETLRHLSPDYVSLTWALNFSWEGNYAALCVAIDISISSHLQAQQNEPHGGQPLAPQLPL